MTRLFDSMVRLGNGTDACGFTAKSDGVTSVLDGDTMFTYGGPVPDKVWALHLGLLKWTQIQCTGHIPAPRTYHSSVTYGNQMLVYGGIADPSYGVGVEETPYYELDLETCEWMRVQTFGESPGPRSHHTAVVHNGKMLVYGGQDLSKGHDHALTAADLHQARAQGFFSLHILDIPSRTWTKVERYEGSQPYLWGHSAVTFNDYMLVFGGFDVSEEEQNGVVTTPQDAPPSATLSNMVYILDLQSFQWRTSTPNTSLPSPAPRALHVAVVSSAEMMVFGGMTFDASGRAINVNDSWIWDIATGRWEKVEFCIPYWPSKRLLHTVHNGRLAVCHDLLSVHVFDFRSKFNGWAKYPTDPSLMLESREQAPWDTQQPSRQISPPRHPQPLLDEQPYMRPLSTAPPSAPSTTATAPAEVPTNPPSHVPSAVPDIPEPPPVAPPSEQLRPPPTSQQVTPVMQHAQPPQPQQPQSVYPKVSPPRTRQIPVPEQSGLPFNPEPHLAPAPPMPQPSITPMQIRVLQDEELRTKMLLQDAERARTNVAVTKLTKEMATLQQELETLANLKEKISHNSHANTSSFTSPTRTRAQAFEMPGGSGANELQYMQVNALSDYLERLQTNQHSVMFDQKRRHEEYMDELKKAHGHHMSALNDGRAQQKVAQQQLDDIKSRQETEDVQHEHLDIIKQQYDKMMELQKAPRPALPPVTSTLPVSAEPMADMINKLSHIPARTQHVPMHAASPSPVPIPPGMGYPFGASYQQSPVVHQSASPIPNQHLPSVPRSVQHQHPASIPRAVSTSSFPPNGAPLPTRKAQHIEGLKHQLAAIEGTMETPYRQPQEARRAPQEAFEMRHTSPRRGPSVVSSPGPYWDRLKDILGDEYVAIGSDTTAIGTLLSPSHAGSPPPRGDAYFESDGMKHVGLI
eukprot:TRINITY_DN18562_c0_g1_i1.p1 TRINITY_DN18562_c0_g1~~TRINITY_DN18562_c0_g1_i1.p1  ORF type:complete len:929 (+),score=172.05 TRINITY_DN18562_c0_g1_i1:46-2787(+)